MKHTKTNHDDTHTQDEPWKLTPPDNLITLTLLPTWGPSPLPLFVRCMTVLFMPGFSSWGLACAEATRAVCVVGSDAAAGFVCNTFCGAWGWLEGTVLVCLSCFTGFICCPWYCIFAPTCGKSVGLGWIFGTTISCFLTRSLFFTFCLVCKPEWGM